MMYNICILKTWYCTQFASMQQAGHYPFLDQPDVFLQKVLTQMRCYLPKAATAAGTNLQTYYYVHFCQGLVVLFRKPSESGYSPTRLPALANGPQGKSGIT